MKRKLITVFVVLFCILHPAAAQYFVEREDVYLARIGQRIIELEMQEALSLWFTDADTGKPIQGARVAIENTGSTITDEDGLAVFPVIDNGSYDFIIQKEGYVTTRDTFTVTSGTIIANKYSIPKILNVENIKIILDWGNTPKDLDAHLVKEGGYHISYRNIKTSSDNTAWLDKDTINGYGPETITITQIDKSSIYEYYVHNYSNRNAINDRNLSQSKATVRIYINNKFHMRYQIDLDKAGTIWYVFEIVNGEIKQTSRFE